MILFPLFETCLHNSKCTCKSKARSDPSTPPIMAWRGASRGAVHFFKTISANDERWELRPMSRSRNEFLRSPPDAALPRDCLDFRVMPASFNLSSMDAPILRPRMVAYAFVSLGNGAALGLGSFPRVAPGAARNWGRGAGVTGVWLAPAVSSACPSSFSRRWRWMAACARIPLARRPARGVPRVPDVSMDSYLPSTHAISWPLCEKARHARRSARGSSARGLRARLCALRTAGCANAR